MKIRFKLFAHGSRPSFLDFTFDNFQNAKIFAQFTSNQVHLQITFSDDLVQLDFPSGKTFSGFCDAVEFLFVQCPCLGNDFSLGNVDGGRFT